MAARPCAATPVIIKSIDYVRYRTDQSARYAGHNFNFAGAAQNVIGAFFGESSPFAVSEFNGS
jgi:hypothetical protein